MAQNSEGLVLSHKNDIFLWLKTGGCVNQAIYGIIMQLRRMSLSAWHESLLEKIPLGVYNYYHEEKSIQHNPNR